MTATVCLGAKTLDYPEGAGHFWVFLNWALGLTACGCRVIWLDWVPQNTPPETARAWAATLESRLAQYGLANCLALTDRSGESLPESVRGSNLDLAAATEADLLLNLHYKMPTRIVARFRRSALLDIDPGLLQLWMAGDQLEVARHDVYFTIGETVGRPEAKFPAAGVEWHSTRPCVSLEWWPQRGAPVDAPFTTVSQWYTGEWVVAEGEEPYQNDKREGFLPFLELPRRTRQALELALPPQGRSDESGSLRDQGWRVRDACTITCTPWHYQAYIQSSAGEFSCAKPSCIRLQNAWISDRTLCYLASGKPAVVQHTGPSGFLPEAEGLFRFRTVEEAAKHLEAAVGEYERHCRLARELAVEFFDARRVAKQVLERALA
jgi:hypothetical protein